MPRDPVAGPDSPVSPFPLPLSGTVTKGFGRGSKDLGIPTGKQFALKEETYQCVLLTKKPIANLPESVAQSAGEVLESGIYYGWASVGSSDPTVRPMVMSFGWNPFYKNERRSAEVHIIHTFDQDFYGETLRVLVTGYLRPEQNYESVDALIADIERDKEIALESLARPAYSALKSHISLI